MKYIIEEKLATTLLNYLIKKPYIEVKHMADALQVLQPFPGESKATACNCASQQIPQND